MDKKVTGIVGYITWFGWLIAYFAGDKEGAKFHLNQSLVLWIIELGIIVVARVSSYIPFIGWLFLILVGLCQIAWFVFLVIAIIGAVKDEEKPLPMIGGIQILK